MSTNSEDASTPLDDWISQAEASRIHGVSRQAISKLVQNGRLKTKEVGGRILVSRAQIESFKPTRAGRSSDLSSPELERLRRLLEHAKPETRQVIFDELRGEISIHPLEETLGLRAEVILGAIARSGELTLRMIRGVIAEAAFEVYVTNRLEGWISEPISGNTPYNFSLSDEVGVVRVQVKLQWSERGVPKLKGDMFVVETQRTRSGQDTSTGQSTRPYKYGEFNILAVAMQPSTHAWNSFLYTVGEWLVPRASDDQLLEVYQPVASEVNDDWTDEFATCVAWLRSGEKKTIHRFV